MVTQFTATFINGVFHPDQPLDLPDQSRVLVSIEPAKDSMPMEKSGWQGMLDLIRERPINSGGLRYTRDELYDRD